MISGRTYESVRLFVGDVIIFYVSLYIMLGIRYAEVPTREVIETHLLPFSILFVVWVCVYYIAGLYDKYTSLLKQRLIRLILNAQVVNIVTAVVFFYFVPYFGITPKTNLFIYLVVSFVLVVGWRVYSPRALGARTRKNAVIIGSGAEMGEMVEEVNANARYPFHFVASFNADDLDVSRFEQEVVPVIQAQDVTLVVVDMQHHALSTYATHLYHLLFDRVQFVDIHVLYENVFDRVPLSFLHHQWFLEYVSGIPHASYDTLKRVMDMCIASVLGVVALAVYPVVALAIKSDDGGPILIRQTRVGKNNEPITIHKFRTMTTDDAGDQRAVHANRPTRIGPFLRKTRLDELPQLWDVLRGDLSLIGPRPELPHLAKAYAEEIPYYNARHLIKPGLSGWAQLYHTTPPKRFTDVLQTKRKLSYDLFYIKNRSFLFDIKIGLKTLKSLAARSGS